MSAIRPLREDDLDTVASLYAEMDRRDPALPAPGYGEFFRRVLLEPPFADPELPSLVYEDPEAGVVGMIGSHPRRFTFGERTLRLVCTGPLVVRPEHRVRGLGALLLRGLVNGPQDATFNDRSTDEVRSMWSLMGGMVDSAGSVGWSKPLAPLGATATRLVHRFTGRRRVPGGAALAAAEGRRRGRRGEGPAGRVAQLDGDSLVELLDRLRRQFPLRPAYDPEFASALLEAMASIRLLGNLHARSVCADDGSLRGAFVAYVMPHGVAEALTVIATPRDAGVVLDHLFRTVAREGAFEVRGRVEPHLHPALRERGCRLTGAEWAMVQSDDPGLVGAALSARGLLNRFDGEWWMRPDPLLSGPREARPA